MAWVESIGGICSGLYLKYANTIPTVLIGQQGGFHVKTIGLGLAATEVALKFGVGIEIDYERNTGPNLEKLEDSYWPIAPFIPTTPMESNLPPV